MNTAALSLLAAAAACSGEGEMSGSLFAAAEALQSALSQTAEAVALRARLGIPAYLDVVGRGPALGVANQSALILRESAEILGASRSAGLLRHGPIHDIGPGRKALLFVSAGSTGKLGLGLVRDLLERGADVALVTDLTGAPAHERLTIIPLPAVDEPVFPIPAIAAAEFLACLWAADRGALPGERVEKVTRVE